MECHYGRHERLKCRRRNDIVAKVGEGQLGRNIRIATKSLNQPCASAAYLGHTSKLPAGFVVPAEPVERAAPPSALIGCTKSSMTDIG
jgi:hypothetical protein